jgi:hypothetical protein
MKFRTSVIFTGKKFKVPQGIQRIDVRSTHGWQLRYGGTKFFNDGTTDGKGAVASLAAAKKELLARINKMPAPSLLQKLPNKTKSNGLPVGISGPIVRLRPGSKVRDCSFSVSVPLYGAKPRRRSVYIATENTFTQERYQAALKRALAMRQEAELKYEKDSTKAKRTDAKILKAA